MRGQSGVRVGEREPRVAAAQQSGRRADRGEKDVLRPAAQLGGDVGASRAEQGQGGAERQVSGRVDHRVEAPSDGAGQRSTAQLEDVGGPQLGQQLRSARREPVAHRCHLHPLATEQLHEGGADATGGTMDEDPVAPTQACHAEAGMGVVRPLHARSRVDQCPSLRQTGDQPVHGNGDPFGMGARPAFDEPEHPVTHRVRLDAFPDLGHHSGVLRPQHLHAGTRPSTDHAVDPGLTRPVGAIGAVHRRRVHLHHDLAAGRHWCRDVLEADDLRAAVLRPNRCAHLFSMASAHRCLCGEPVTGDSQPRRGRSRASSTWETLVRSLAAYSAKTGALRPATWRSRNGFSGHLVPRARRRGPRRRAPHLRGSRCGAPRRTAIHGRRGRSR